MNSIQSSGKHIYQIRSRWFLTKERREGGKKNKYGRAITNREHFPCQNDCGPTQDLEERRFYNGSNLLLKGEKICVFVALLLFFYTKHPYDLIYVSTFSFSRIEKSSVPLRYTPVTALIY